MFLRYEPVNKANRRAVNAVVSSMLPPPLETSAAVSTMAAHFEVPRREFWAGRGEAMLTGQEVRELNTLLRAHRGSDVPSAGSCFESAAHQITFVLRVPTDRPIGGSLTVPGEFCPRSPGPRSSVLRLTHVLNPLRLVAKRFGMRRGPVEERGRLEELELPVRGAVCSRQSALTCASLIGRNMRAASTA